MNKVQKTITQAQLKAEQRALKELKKSYEKAKKDVELKISALNARKDMQNLQSIIYQKKYQQILLKQIEGVLDDLNQGQYQTMQDFFEGSYSTGYIGSMYDLQSQGIPLTVPIDPKKMEKAVKTDSKLSKNYYQNRVLPENLSTMRRNIRLELTRGIASGKTWIEVAYQVASGMNSPLDRAMRDAMRIIRTEGHRINQQGFLDASHEAKDKGADVVKQWDATLDGITRPWHQEADGQIRELEEKFNVGGEEMDAPSVGGSAKNVCNCRCQLLQRAKWALDEDELKVLQDRASFFGLDKSQDFEDFKQKYLQLPKNADKIDIVKTYDVLGNTQKLKRAMNNSDYEEYMKLLTEHDNKFLQKLYVNYADKINDIRYEKSGGYYSPSENKLVFSYPLQKYIDNGRSKYHTLAHEYGHYFDKEAIFDGLHFKEIEMIHSKTRFQTIRFEKIASSSDEFLNSVRKDREYLKNILDNNLENDLRMHDASCGVQDAIDGLLAHRINWGHGDKYYNRKYHSVKLLNEHKGLQEAYKELGIAKTLKDTAFECRIYESASEIWANIMGGEVNGGSELEYVKKYLPHSYNTFIEILKGVK